MSDPAALVLNRLANVRRFGMGWRADCPVGHKSRGALSLSQGDDGRLLMHCFAGCTPGEVLDAIGLSLGDLYTERLKPQTPEQQREFRRGAKQAGWAAAVGVLAREATVVEIVAETLRQGQALTADDVDRLHVAANRIHDVREVLAA